MRARMYDPRTGRFTQNDPILGNRPGEHYIYVGNNPISRIDPKGDRWKIEHGPAAETMLRDLAKYTGRQFRVDKDGNVYFDKPLQKRKGVWASKADLAWIEGTQKDPERHESIEKLWIHMVSGDEWHRERFKEAWLAYSGLDTATWAFVKGGAAGGAGAALTIATGPLGGVAIGFIAKELGFENVSLGAWIMFGGQTASMGVFTYGAATGAFVTTATTGVTAAASPQGQQVIQQASEYAARKAQVLQGMQEEFIRLRDKMPNLRLKGGEEMDVALTALDTLSKMIRQLGGDIPK